MTLISLIVFSKDRAAQLELLSRSLRVYAEGVFDTDVLWKFSNKEYFDAYYNLIQENGIRFCREISFQENTRFLVKNCKHEYIAFSTDDTVLFRQVDNKTLKEVLPKYNNETFSFRLGRNTIQQDIHRGTVQPPLNAVVEHEGWMEWPINMYHPHENYGYPFGLDLHVFRKDLLVELIDEFDFNNTNQLESHLTTRFRHRIDTMKSFTHSVAVNIPVNSISGVTRAGEIAPSTLDDLNKAFLAGKRISLDNISKTKIVGAHQEIKYEYSQN